MPKDTKTQSEFNKRVDEWKTMDRTTEDAQNAALTFYDEDVFPLVKKVFLSNPENRPNKKYDALILPLGFSPEPLILSILALKPQQVGLIYTKQTKGLLDRIQKETGLTLDQLKLHEIDGSNTLEIYQTIMTFYKEWHRPVEIAVDITGGKKSMVGGAAMAGAALGADIYYVDNTKFTKFGKPEPGTEYLSLLDNPYTVFGDLEVEKAGDLYNGHDYAGAQRVFGQLEKQVGDPYLATIHEAYGHLCAAYELWDNIDFEKALETIDKLLPILTKYSSLPGLINLHSFCPILLEQRAALEALKVIADNEKLALTDNEKLALSIPEGFHFAFMLYHSALRRENQGKLDMACLLLYRVLEWIGQHRLAQYSINSSEPDYSKSGMDQDDLLEKYKTKRKDIYKKDKRSIENLPNPIALMDGFLILDILGDEIVEGLNWHALRGQIEMRNKNIFAHGINKISPDNYEKFKSTVKERFKKAQEITSIDADAFNKQHEFIAPLP